MTTQDPFDMPAGEVKDPSFPLVREGRKRMEIGSFERVEYKDKEGKDAARLSIKLLLTEDDRSTENQPLYKGWGFNVTIFLNPTERTTLVQCAEQASMPVKAALGRDTKVTAKQCWDNPSLIVGKPVDVLIKVRKSKDPQYDDSNEVKQWIVPGDK